MPIDLLEPFLDNGIRHTNFFEGRVVSGLDFQEEQEANHRHRRHLGLALGHGIVEGLEVEMVSAGGDAGDPATLRVRCGLALNRKGDMLQLPQDVEVQLQPVEEKPADDAGVFTDCDDVLTTLIPSGVGLYLLVMSPASGYLENAPKSGLGSGGKVAGCGKKHQVEGVLFHLIFLNTTVLSDVSDDSREELGSLYGTTDPESVHLLRNWASHLFLGTEPRLSSFDDPLALAASGDAESLEYGAIDDLRAAAVLTDCDVPLAAFHWTVDGINFLDLWAVRRRLHRPSPSAAWPAAVAARVLAEGEASFLQFQRQLNDLRDDRPAPDTIAARDFFRFLPAAGFFTAPQSAPSSSNPEAVFFGDKPTRGPEFLDAARMRSLFALSFDQPAIDVRDDDEMVWLYKPWQQRRAIEGSFDRALVLFAGPHMPYLANARFDVARWEYSNYARLGNAGW